MKRSNYFAAIVYFMFVWIFSAALVSGQSKQPLPTPTPKIVADEVIKVDTDLVTLTATVTDQNGRYRADLKQSDFTRETFRASRDFKNKARMRQPARKVEPRAIIILCNRGRKILCETILFSENAPFAWRFFWQLSPV